MAFTITSYTPTTGSVDGGTECTVTGTGLDVVDVVLVGDNRADIIGTPTSTTLVFVTPPSTGLVTGTAPVILGDEAGSGEFHEAGVAFTYAAAVGDEILDNTNADKFRIEVSDSLGTTWDLGTDAWHVRGVTTYKEAVSFTTEDNSDSDAGFDGSDYIPTRKTQYQFTVKRGRGHSSGNYDPGQEKLRLAKESVSQVACRVYDRYGGPEAYTFVAYVQWDPQGGGKTKDTVNVVLLQQGARATIANPVIADSSLAGPYGG